MIYHLVWDMLQNNLVLVCAREKEVKIVDKTRFGKMLINSNLTAHYTEFHNTILFIYVCVWDFQ